jgi:hypothetical protein
MKTNFLEKNLPSKTLILSFIFIAILTFLAPIRFETNDDVIMLLISSGSLYGSPDEHLVFINILFGFVLKVMYSIVPKIECYTYLFLTLHAISFSIILHYVITRQLQTLSKTIMIGLVFFLETILVYKLQFTTTSALITSSAVVMLIKQNKKLIFIGFLLLLIGFCIRPHACLLALLVSIPVIFHANIKSPRKLVSLGLITLGLIISITAIDTIYYRSNIEWKKYSEYNSVRGQINDNPNFETLLPRDEKERINFLMIAYFMMDPKVHTITGLNSIKSRIVDKPLSLKIQNVSPQLIKHKEVLIYISLFSAIILLKIKGRDRFFLASSYSILILSLCYTGINGTIKTRVLMTAIIPFLVLTTPYFLCNLNSTIKNIFTCIPLIMIAYRFSSQAYNTHKFNIQDNVRCQEQISIIDKYQKVSDKKLLVWPSAISLSSFEPMGISEYFKNKNIHFTGWLTQIPLEKDIHSHLDLIGRMNILVSSKNLEKNIPNLIKAIYLNHQVKVQVDTILTSKNLSIINLKHAM